MPKRIAKRNKKRLKPDLKTLVLILSIGFVGAILIWLITKPVKPGLEEIAPAADSLAASVSDLPPSLDEKIKETLVKLGVPDNGYGRRKRSGNIVYTISIDRSEMDLTYANMIFKGAAESIGAQFLSGSESGGRQSLKLRHEGQDYLLNLSYNSEPYSKKENPKYVAIVVDDFGLIGGELLEGFFSLPTHVTFAIFPELEQSVHTMNRARQQGRETLIHVPMEPLNYPQVDPGPNPILVQMSEAEIARLLHRYLDQMPYCIGINNHMGSFATTDPDVMAHVMKVLKERGKVFLDSRTSNVSVAYQTAQKAHIPAYRNDIFLDSPDVSNSTFEKKLEQIRTMSQTNGNIIAITHCHNLEKLEYLKAFIKRLEAAGFVLIPLSRVGKYDVPAII